MRRGNMLFLGLGLDQSSLDANFARPLFILPILTSCIVLITIVCSLPLIWDEVYTASFQAARGDVRDYGKFRYQQLLFLSPAYVYNKTLVLSKLNVEDRLPTFSASQALQNLRSTSKRPISTGLRRLDAALQGKDYEISSQDDLLGGISRGEVTEVYGPPGVGKTAFA